MGYGPRLEVCIWVTNLGSRFIFGLQTYTRGLYLGERIFFPPLHFWVLSLALGVGHLFVFLPFLFLSGMVLFFLFFMV